MGLLPDGPWLRDSEGDDVLDDVNSPFSGEPIVDPIDLTETFGSNPVTRTVEGADRGTRVLASTMLPGTLVGMGTGALDGATDAGGDVDGSTPIPGVSATIGRINDLTSDDPEDPTGTGRLDGEGSGSGGGGGVVGTAFVLAVVTGIALWLLRPVLGIVENATEG